MVLLSGIQTTYFHCRGGNSRYQRMESRHSGDGAEVGQAHEALLEALRSDMMSNPLLIDTVEYLKSPVQVSPSGESSNPMLSTSSGSPP